MKKIIGVIGVLAFGLLEAATIQSVPLQRYIIEVPATTKEQRTQISNLGLAIDEVHSDRVFIMGDSYDKNLLKNSGFKFIARKYKDQWDAFDKAPRAEKYRSYTEVVQALKNLAAQNPDIASYQALGKSLQGNDQPMLRISSLSAGEAEAAKTPAILYQGCHHAREHLSMEVPLRFAEYLVKEYKTNENVRKLVDGREIFIAPIINPDGFIYDYTNGVSGKNWRKNRRTNSNGSYGVDLNRNYGFQWGGGGASASPSSDTFRGPNAFSEVEIQNIRTFVKSLRHRMQSVMDFHSFSELILYPWGYQYDAISNSEDMQRFSKMATQMAKWNNYTPEAASELYIASGVSIDYFYGELGMTTFTFELSPRSMFEGGFYLSPSRIESVFLSNLKPMMYMLEYSDDPSRVLREELPDYLRGNLKTKNTKIADFHDLGLNL